MIILEQVQMGGDMRHPTSLLSVWYHTNEVKPLKYWKFDTRYATPTEVNLAWKSELQVDHDLFVPVSDTVAIHTQLDTIYQITHKLYLSAKGGANIWYAIPLFSLNLNNEVPFKHNLFVEEKKMEIISPEKWTQLIIKVSQLTDNLKNLELHHLTP